MRLGKHLRRSASWRSRSPAPDQGCWSFARRLTFHRYAGVEHWFCEPDRAAAYDQPAADLAWHRTLAFLTRPIAG
jgi:dienelactone hydrolase